MQISEVKFSVFYQDSVVISCPVDYSLRDKSLELLATKLMGEKLASRWRSNLLYYNLISAIFDAEVVFKSNHGKLEFHWNGYHYLTTTSRLIHFAKILVGDVVRETIQSKRFLTLCRNTSSYHAAAFMRSLKVLPRLTGINSTVKKMWKTLFTQQKFCQLFIGTYLFDVTDTNGFMEGLTFLQECCNMSLNEIVQTVRNFQEQITSSMTRNENHIGWVSVYPMLIELLKTSGPTPQPGVHDWESVVLSGLKGLRIQPDHTYNWEKHISDGGVYFSSVNSPHSSENETNFFDEQFEYLMLTNRKIASATANPALLDRLARRANEHCEKVLNEMRKFTPTVSLPGIVLETWLEQLNTCLRCLSYSTYEPTDSTRPCVVFLSQLQSELLKLSPVVHQNLQSKAMMAVHEKLPEQFHEYTMKSLPIDKIHCLCKSFLLNCPRSVEQMNADVRISYFHLQTAQERADASHSLRQAIAYSHYDSEEEDELSGDERDRRDRNSPQTIFRVQRDKLLLTSLRSFMNHCTTRNSREYNHLPLIQFIGEDVSGDGVLREWITLLTQILFDEHLGLWRKSENGFMLPSNNRTDRTKLSCLKELFDDHDNTVFGYLYYFAGYLVGLCLTHNISIGVQLPSYFINPQLAVNSIQWEAAVEEIDPETASTLRNIQKMSEDDLKASNCTFTYNDKELTYGGSSLTVTLSNRDEYVRLCRKYVSVEQFIQFKNFKDGSRMGYCFRTLNLMKFTPTQLTGMIWGSKDLDVDEWRMHSTLDQGKMDTTMFETSVKLFWEAVQKLSIDNRRKLLHFWTGQSFVHKFSDLDLKLLSDKYIRSSTCTQGLYLPQYSDIDTVTKDIQRCIDNATYFGKSD